MEILAPAGSYAQGIELLNFGSDAIYGGLKKWNARNRAINFTEKEYIDIIKYCRRHDKNFYLVLNTLMNDYEIKEIIEYFQSGLVPLPNAFIVADIGLIMELRKKFPMVPIHVSTQFGAYSIEDIKFLENLGVKRIILARELTISEISFLCNKTSLEIEVFIYGSQCTAFSGQCLWGGLINGSSGNRGRCIGMCRDIYLINNKEGQFLYNHDLNIIKYVAMLEKIGVSSVKIEGRLRKLSELVEIVGICRNEIFNKNEICGIEKERLVDKSLNKNQNLRQIKIIDKNSRTRDKTISCINIKNNSFEFSINNHLNFRGVNIALKFIIEDSKLIGVEYIDNDGGKKLFIWNKCNSESYSIGTVKEVEQYFIKNIKHNIYELSYNVPSKTNIIFNAESMKNVIEEINRFESIEKTKYRIEKFKEYEYIEVSDYDDILRIEKNNEKYFNYKYIIYNIRSLTELKKVLHINSIYKNIIFKLPILDFNHKLKSILPLLNDTNIMITKISQLYFIKKYNFKTIIADYTLNIWNKHSVKFLENYGIEKIVFNPELSFVENYTLIKDTNIKGIALGFGKLKIGYSRKNFNGLSYNSVVSAVNLQKGYELKIINNSYFGFSEILLNKIFTISKNFNIEKIFIFDNYNDYDKDFKLLYNRSVK